MDVITLTIDVGNSKDFEAARLKALKVGAIKAIVIDAKDMFVKYFIWPALQANALYEGQYPLATALSRPLMAKVTGRHGTGRRRDHGGTRLHRQRQRPGQVRCRCACFSAATQSHRPGA